MIPLYSPKDTCLSNTTVAARTSVKRRQGLNDDRFARLMPAAQWQALPPAIQQRFTKTLPQGETQIYRGHITETRLSFAGMVIAQSARLFGSPLPYENSGKRSAVVCVTQTPDQNGQYWSRFYEQHHGFPQIIQSMKRFSGATGLEEYIGYGVGMALTIRAENKNLIFESHHYFLQILGLKLKLPRFLTIGKLKITHKEEANQQFSFTLQLTNCIFGRLIYQHAVFVDG